MRARSLLAPALAVLVAVSCYAPTEVVIAISTDLACDTVRARGVVIGLAGESDRPLSVAHDCAGASPAPMAGLSDVGTLVFVPSDDRSSSFVVEIIAGVTENAEVCAALPAGQRTGCIVARRSVRFSPHRSQRLPITLFASCAGVECKPEEICDRGGSCVAADTCVGDGCNDAGLPPPTTDGGEPPLTCGPGLGDCDGNAANGCETALSKTDAHCGECGYSCEGRGCVDGACAPAILFSGVANPTAIAIEGKDVFVTSTVAAGRILTCPVTGCATPTVLKAGLDRPDTIVADADFVYWGENQVTVQRCARPSCVMQTSFYADSASQLFITPEAVFLFSRFNAYVGRWRKPNAANIDQYGPGNQFLGGAVVGDAKEMYATNGGIARCAIGTTCNGAPGVKVPDNVSIFGMWLDTKHVYWTELESGRVVRATRDLATVDVLSTTAVRPYGIIVDDAFIYWTEQGAGAADGVIRRAAKTGGNVRTLARGQTKPTGIALAAGRVFWTNPTAGTVASARAR